LNTANPPVPAQLPATNSAEIWDPTSNQWTTVAPMSANGRATFTLSALPNGKVLAVGGTDKSGLTQTTVPAEVYDPNAGPLGTWTATTGALSVPRYFHTATLVGGKVIIIGGATAAGSSIITNVVESYDPTADSFTTLVSLTENGQNGYVGGGRKNHTATLLQSGKILVAGGLVPKTNGVSGTQAITVANAEIYDPGASTPAATTIPFATTTAARSNHAAALLPDGRVLMTGGNNSGTLVGEAEIFDPAGNGGLGSFSAAGSFSALRYNTTASLLQVPVDPTDLSKGLKSDGSVLVTGGTLADAISEVFHP
jgi:N-acetylneuraminic acid mutarotase